MGRTVRSIELDDELYAWVRTRWKGKGLYWLVNRLLEEFKNEVEAIDMDAPTRKAAATVKAELDAIKGGVT